MATSSKDAECGNIMSAGRTLEEEGVLQVESAVREEDAVQSGGAIHQRGVVDKSTSSARSTEQSVASSAAPPRKRGRPKGSKNKPKSAEPSSCPPTGKRGRPLGSKNKLRCSLEAALTQQRRLTASAVGLPEDLTLPLLPPKSSEPLTSVDAAATDQPSSPTSRSTITTPELASSGQNASSPVTNICGDNEAGGRALSTPPPAFSAQCTSARQSPALAALYVNTLVAFSPAKEGWTVSKKYVGVGNAFIVGRVCRFVKGLYQVMWLDTQFQSQVESMSLSMIQRGNTNYSSLHGRATGPGWSRLCAVEPGESVQIDGSSDVLEECMEPYEPQSFLPSTLAEVEAIQNFRFEPSEQMEAPRDLFHHEDMTTTTRLRSEFRHIFEHSASASFFAYIPVYFWQQVVGEMNTYARIHDVALGAPVTLQDVMTFMGILFYMALVDKGEYSNYWGIQVEDSIFGGSSVGLDTIMTLRRFKQLRQVFTFQCVPQNSTNQDQAARIRPLLNLLKSTGSRYIEVGRNVALDEASVACRSKYGKPLIVYNPLKPGGKYHFRIYMLCCATTWISLNFRLHCASTITDRLAGVTTADEAQALSEEISESSVIRQCVLEVVRPVYGTHRIVNSDNYYTSVQLLEALRVKGLYSRGTVRKSSAHFPRHVLVEKKDCSRGSSRQAVSRANGIIAASWYDSSIVSVISNADASTLTTVTRQVNAEKRAFSAPTCIRQYNTYMQGVDRLDQIRGRFSVADGHSFKKWHKKLGLALVDVARANAFLTRKLALDLSGDRDPHRDFIVQLISELFSGKWKDAPSERSMFFAETGASEVASLRSPVSAVWSAGSANMEGSVSSPQKRCSAVSSKQIFADMSRKRRQCVVCRWEERYATEVTDYCVLYGVCLCQIVHAFSPKVYTCPQVTWTCWEKYHRYYLPRKLFSSKGKVRSSSELYKLKQHSSGDRSSAVRSLNI